MTDTKLRELISEDACQIVTVAVPSAATCCVGRSRASNTV